MAVIKYQLQTEVEGGQVAREGLVSQTFSGALITKTGSRNRYLLVII